MSELEKQKRYHGLDLVRAVAMMLGLVIHVSIFFMDDQNPWMMGERVTDGFNRLIFEFIHLFRMQLFYLIAGFFALLVIERKSFQMFLRDRTKRILCPFLFAALFLVPLHDLVIAASGQPSLLRTLIQEESFLRAARDVVLFGAFAESYPREFVGFWHYWFLHYLLWIYGIHIVCRKLVPEGGKEWLLAGLRRILRSPYAALYLGLLCFPVHYSLSDALFLPNHLNFEYNNLGYYCIFYFFGVGLYHHREAIAGLERRCFLNLGLGLIMVPFTMQLTPIVVNITPSVVHDLLNFKVHGFHFNREALFEGGALKASVVLLRTCGAWLLGLGFIGLAERFVKKDHFVVRYISDASYWIFYAHMIFTFSLSFLLTKLDVLNSATKAYLLLVLCFYFLWWTYNAFVRYSWLGDFFMGKRKVRIGGPASNHFATSTLIKQTWRPVLIGLLAVYVLGTGLRQQSLLEQKPFLNEAQIAQDPLFFEEAGPLDEVRDPYGRTALHLAASTPNGYRDYNPIEKLLPHFKHPDVLDMMRRTPLFNASRKGNMEDVRLLLAAGADPNLPDRYGHTAAHASAIKLHLRDPDAVSVHRRILNLLQEHGADMTLKDARGRTVRDLETRL